jgi:hypothetical protein
VNPADPLAQLHPLREPAAIGWWPPAPGWWLLLALVALLGLLALWLSLKRYRANAYRRQALSQLQRLYEAYREGADKSVFLAQTNALLKAVALQAYPRRAVAASSGEAWFRFLNSQLADTDQFPPEFMLAAYRKDCPEIDAERLNHVARCWIKCHEVAND